MLHIKATTNETARNPRGLLSSLTSGTLEPLLGRLFKGVTYGSNLLKQLNSPFLCPLLAPQTLNARDTSDLQSNAGDESHDDQPTLYVFNDRYNHDKAVRIYADDEITRDMLLREAQFDATQLTVLLVHGWLGGIHHEQWLSGVKNMAATMRGTSSNSTVFRPNIVVVDWSELAHGSLYSATRSSIVISRRLSRLLGELVRVGGLRPELMHCLGHSLGAHICGRAARLAFPSVPGAELSRNASLASLGVAPRMGRITGLDPGGFCYELGVRDEHTYTGMKPSDAHIVDALYSNRVPFGNRHQVALYNVRINNAVTQPPCTLAGNAERARDYFRTAVSFLMGGSRAGGEEKLTCEHFFATRLAMQSPPNECSYVAYACSSYADYLSGRCGACEDATPMRCYPMDFEFQRAQPSVQHALEHIARYAQHTPAPYSHRRPMFLRSGASEDEPRCAPLYRVRVRLDARAVDVQAFQARWLNVRLVTAAAAAATATQWRDTRSNKLATPFLAVHGPWSGSSEQLAADALDNRTLTALVELVGAASQPQRIDAVEVLYELGALSAGPHNPLASPIDSVAIDYLSAGSRAVRAKYSRAFSAEQVRVQYAHLESHAERAATQQRRNKR